ncbi:hypothetical protein ACSSS7_002858 [Eimeria intestinalis]
MEEEERATAEAMEAAAAAAAASQPTPCNINRKLLLLLYLWYAFSTGCVYLGWAALSRLLYSSGVYEVLCDPKPPPIPASVSAPAPDAAESAAAAAAADSSSWEPLCPAQEVAMNKLFTVAMASHFSSSLLVGLLLDRWGPSKTALLGQAIGISGWSLLASLGQRDTEIPVIAFVLIGLAVDASLLPCLGIGNVFPGRRGIVMASMGAAASASMAIPLLLLRVAPDSDLGLGRLWFYVGFGPGLCLLLTQFILPERPFRGKAEILDDMLKGKNDYFIKANMPHHNSEPLQTAAAESAEAAAAAAAPADISGRNSEEESVFNSVAAPSDAVAPPPDAPRVAAGVGGLGGETMIRKEGDPTFIKLVFSLDYLLIVFYFMDSAASSAFFQQTCRRLLSPRAVSFLEILMAGEMLFSLPVGAFIDAAGVLPALYVLNSSGLISYVFTVPRKPRGLGFASAFFFVFYISMLRGPVLIYLQTNYPSSFFGRLAGVASLLGGIMTLCLNPLLEFALRDGGAGIDKARAGIVSLLLLQYVWLTALFVRHKRKKRHLKRQCLLQQQQHKHQQQHMLQQEAV